MQYICLVSHVHKVISSLKMYWLYAVFANFSCRSDISPTLKFPTRKYVPGSPEMESGTGIAIFLYMYPS